MNMNLPAATNALELYISQINQFALLTPEEEFKLAVRYKKHNDMEAAEKLVTSNLRFVVKIAHEYRNYGVKLLDLIQEGNVGLMHAVKKFDPYKGYRLISYAVWWIRAYMQNFIIKTWSLVKIGTTQAQRKLFFKLNQAKKKLQNMAEKSPEFGEIAESLSVKESEIEEMDVRLNSRDLSLDAFIDDDGELTHINCLADKSESQEDALIRHEETALAQRNVAGALAKLSDREAYIIQRRVMSENPETLQEIGDRFKITRERARQVEKEALRKMRQAIVALEPARV
ncbi:MAG TPA: RNA polymerase sigma factor RpoH [Syntrophales bacterium]|nr:RNA polymerase sigma factor RpoH [Syntrophales bacterium]